MSEETRDCGHCKGKGSCGCFSCVAAVRGREYAEMRQNLIGKVDSYNENADKHPFLGLIGAVYTPLAEAHAKETYPCTTCGGRGFFVVHPGKRW